MKMPPTNSTNRRRMRRYFHAYLHEHNVKFEEARNGLFEMYNMTKRRREFVTPIEILSMYDFAIETIYDLLPESVPRLKDRARAIKEAHKLYHEIYQ
jgi:hypothetical protein